MSSENVSLRSSFFDAAQAYVALGWHVFPLHYPINGRCSCGRSLDLKEHPAAKHPLTPRGFKDATTDPKVIEAWAEKHSSANIGIATGLISGVAVLDIDVKPGKNGIDSLERLLKIRGLSALLPTMTVTTGSGGVHYYFDTAGRAIRSGTDSFGPDFPGIDTRGEGGYVVAPPSVHASGALYTVRVEVSHAA